MTVGPTITNITKINFLQYQRLYMSGPMFYSEYTTLHIFAHYKKYDSNIIANLDFDVLIELFTKSLEERKYVILFKLTLSYVLKCKLYSILFKYYDYINYIIQQDIEKKCYFFEILYYLSSYNIKFKKYNQDIILFFKKIANNDIFYNNLKNDDYKLVKKLLEIDKENINEIDQIIINNIHNHNIINTIEYTNN